MFKLTSRSATVLVIFIVACIAFCLASVFASMTGPISILPNESDDGGVLDNLSVLTDSDNNDYQSYGYEESKDYSSSSDDSQSSEPQVETTTDDSQQETTTTTTTQTSTSTSSSSSSSSSSHSSGSGGDSSGDSSPEIETTRG